MRATITKIHPINASRAEGAFIRIEWFMVGMFDPQNQQTLLGMVSLETSEMILRARGDYS